MCDLGTYLVNEDLKWLGTLKRVDYFDQVKSGLGKKLIGKKWIRVIADNKKCGLEKEWIEVFGDCFWVDSIFVDQFLSEFNYQWIHFRVDSDIWGFNFQWIRFQWIHFGVDSIIWGQMFEWIRLFEDSKLVDSAKGDS